MIRQLVSFTEPQHVWIKKEAVRLGLPSVAELMRRLVDAARGEVPVVPKRYVELGGKRSYPTEPKPAPPPVPPRKS